MDSGHYSHNAGPGTGHVRGSCVYAPRMHPAPDVDVWWGRVGGPDEVRAQRSVAMPLLSPEDLRRLGAFTDPGAAAGFVLAGLLLRYAVGTRTGRPWRSVAVHRRCTTCGGPHGKPRVPGVEVSVSHSGDLVVVAVAGSVEVGVDVELPGHLDVASVAPFALGATEQDDLAALPPERHSDTLLRWWTRKESVLKMTGEGLAVDPRELVLTGPDLPARILSWHDHDELVDEVTLFDLDLGVEVPGSVASLALHTRDEVEVHIRQAPTDALTRASHDPEPSWAG